MGLAPMVVPRCSRTDDPDVGHWILNRIVSWRIIDRMGYLKQSGGPLLHQMLKINHLLTLRSPNANNWRELDQPLRRDRIDAFFARCYISFACQASGSRYGCPTRSKTNVRNERLSGQSQPPSRSRARKTRRTCIRCNRTDGSDRRNRSPPFRGKKPAGT